MNKQNKELRKFLREKTIFVNQIEDSFLELFLKNPELKNLIENKSNFFSEYFQMLNINEYIERFASLTIKPTSKSESLKEFQISSKKIEKPSDLVLSQGNEFPLNSENRQISFSENFIKSKKNEIEQKQNLIENSEKKAILIKEININDKSEVQSVDPKKMNTNSSIHLKNNYSFAMNKKKSIKDLKKIKESTLSEEKEKTDSILQYFNYVDENEKVSNLINKQTMEYLEQYDDTEDIDYYNQNHDQTSDDEDIKQINYIEEPNNSKSKC